MLRMDAVLRSEIKNCFFFSRKLSAFNILFQIIFIDVVNELIPKASVKCFMCLCLVRTLIGEFSNKFRGENHTTETVFFLDLW